MKNCIPYMRQKEGQPTTTIMNALRDTAEKMLHAEEVRIQSEIDIMRQLAKFSALNESK